MSGCFSPSRFLLALLLSVTILGNGAVCAAVCEEHAEPRELVRRPAAEGKCLIPQEKDEACPLTATAVILQERQTVDISGPLSAGSLPLSFNAPAFSRSVTIAAAGQDSPPARSGTALFIRFCTFRI